MDAEIIEVVAVGRIGIIVGDDVGKRLGYVGVRFIGGNVWLRG